MVLRQKGKAIIMTNKEIEFTKNLEKIVKIAKEQDNFLATNQVEEVFQEQGLSEEQMTFVYEYLNKNKIGVDETIDLDSYLTKEDKDYLSLYIEELNQIEELSEGQKHAVTLSAMSGDQAAKNNLIEIFLPKVIELSKLFVGQGVLVEDLIGEGNLALSLGVEMLRDLEKPEEVEPTLGKIMLDAMETYIYDNTKVGEADKVAREKADFLQEKSKEIAQLLHRKISVEELARETDTSLDEILDIMQITAGALEYVEDTQDGTK